MDRKPSSRHDHAGPLPAAEVTAEVALGDHGEKHQPAREHGLHDRQRRERKRTDVKPPRGQRDRPTERQPARAEQAHGAAQRMTRPHRRRQHRATLLEQKRDVRAERRAQRQRQPSNHRPTFSTTRPAATDTAMGAPLEPGHDVVADARCLVVQLDAGGSPSRAIASGRRSGGRADRVGLRWFGTRPLARCAVAVWRRLPPRPAVIPGRHSARHAYAPPNCLPSASSSSSLPVPLGLARKEHEDPARFRHIGTRPPGRWGNARRSTAPAPQSKPVTHASRLVAHERRRWHPGLG
jgi:hypothetical protein